MFSVKHLLIVTLLLAISNLHFEASGDDPLGGAAPPQTASKCDAPCQPTTPPSGYPAYVAPPPPPPSGYVIYSAPPPPHKSGQSKCPPAQGTPYTPPYGTYYGPPSTYYGPPIPYYTYGPPNVYTPVPYGQGTRSASRILPILAPVMMLFSSFIFVF